MSVSINDLLYRNFVMPVYCKLLQNEGLDLELPFFWKLYDGPMLKSYAFDREDFYKLNDRRIDSVNPHMGIVPAFQINELCVLLPDYYMSKENGLFSIALSSLYSVPFIKDTRLPDAYARLVLELIKARVIIPGNAIHLLNTQIG